MIRLCVSVVAKCPRLCSAGRDRNLWFERELAAFLRELVCLVVEPSSLPPDFEVLAVLKLRLGESKPVDKARFQVLFGQYFRFDVVSQKPFFYKEVQNFLRTVCESCIGDYDQGWVKHLSLLPLVPYAIQLVSMDRLTDILVGTLSVLSFGDLCRGDQGAIILQQYREVVNYFKHRWESNASVVPGIDNAMSLWLSYPSWDRCQEFRGIVEILFVGMLHDSYAADFQDVGDTALDDSIMLSSLNIIRSWMSSGFGGHSRRSMIGFVRHCSTTDMQVSRLTDEGRANPWDQLVKRGVDESLGRCVTVLETTGGLPTRPVIDDYVSDVCNQLRTIESSPTAPRRSPVKSRRSAAQAPKLQSEVVVSSAGPSESVPKRKAVSRTSGGNHGQRTGGKPDKKGKRTLATFETEPVQASRRAFSLEESSNEGGSSRSTEY